MGKVGGAGWDQLPTSSPLRGIVGGVCVDVCRTCAKQPMRVCQIFPHSPPQLNYLSCCPLPFLLARPK